MCGICGVAGPNMTTSEHNLFKRLLFLNVWRGAHSTGVIRASEKEGRQKIQTQKSLLPSPEYIFQKPGAEFIKYDASINRATALVGHCRHATKGNIILRNAHPFGFSEVVGVHNGTITLPFEGTDKYDTDSEALYKLINDVGITEALKIIAYKQPAYALAWINKKDRTLNFIKNSKRPLHFTFIYNKTTIAWSSDEEDLRHALKQLSLTPTGWDKDSGDIFTLNTNDLLTIPLNKPAFENATITHLDVPVSLVSSSYQTSGFHNMYGGADEYDQEWWDQAEIEREKRKAARASRLTGDNDGSNLSYLPWLEQPAKPPKFANKGEPETEAELEFRLSQGCFCCNTKISMDDTEGRAGIHWWGREYYSCSDCYDNVTGHTDWVWRSIENDWESEEPPKAAVH